MPGCPTVANLTVLYSGSGCDGADFVVRVHQLPTVQEVTILKRTGATSCGISATGVSWIPLEAIRLSTEKILQYKPIKINNLLVVRDNPRP